MRTAALLMSVVLFSLLLSPCFADTSQNGGSVKHKIWYKAAGCQDGALLHSSKDCPHLKNKGVVEVPAPDKNCAPEQTCPLCGKALDGAAGKMPSADGYTASGRSPAEYKTSNGSNLSGRTGKSVKARHNSAKRYTKSGRSSSKHKAKYKASKRSVLSGSAGKPKKGRKSSSSGYTKSRRTSPYYKHSNYKRSSYKRSNRSSSSAGTGRSGSSGSSSGSRYHEGSSSSGTPTTYTGSKGGRYHYSASGKKVYERKKKKR